MHEIEEKKLIKEKKLLILDWIVIHYRVYQFKIKVIYITINFYFIIRLNNNNSNF